MAIVRSSETSERTYQAICFLTKVVTTQYEIKVFEVKGASLFYRPQILYKIAFSNLTYLRPFEGPRRRWEDNIKMDLQGLRYGGVDWIELAEDGDSWRALRLR
jgi:hypothetical protein